VSEAEKMLRYKNVVGDTNGQALNPEKPMISLRLPMHAADMRKRAAECRPVAGVPTSGGAGVDRILIAIAERLEYEAVMAGRDDDRSRGGNHGEGAARRR
jgi:hypothetical protein